MEYRARAARAARVVLAALMAVGGWAMAAQNVSNASPEGGRAAAWFAQS